MSNTNMGPHNIEITNDECILLFYTLQLAENATRTLPYDSSTAMTDTNKFGKSEATDYLDLVKRSAEKMIEDAGGRDKNRINELLESLYKKITEKMNRESS
jgi:hypothetical protein